MPKAKKAKKTQKRSSKSEASKSEASKLEAYRATRDFGQTPEPGGSEAEGPPSGGRRFVVQRHRARRLHYDLRLEVDGVLLSWAVPKGPTLDPSARVLAVHVEDHPIEYFDFEGVIPKGEYGGGDVIVWDWGTWEPANTDDPAAAIAAGELHLDLHGEKLAGRLVLIRRDTGGSGKEQWLLLHKRDEHAVPGWNPENHPRSVKTGRTNDEVAAAPEAMWRSDLPAADALLALPGPEAGEIRLPPAENAGLPNDTRPARRTATQEQSLPPWQPVTAAELAALDALGTRGTWSVQGRELSLTNLDKVLFPSRDDEAPITKRDLVRYHAQIALVMLPYLVDRPVNLHRYPNGVDRPGFWHKELPRYAPEWIRRWRNVDADPGETECYGVVDSSPGLAWMANYAALELHPWTSRIPNVHRPTWAFIDIDPGPATTFDEVLALARLFRTALAHLGVLGLPKVTGQRGVQIWIPIVDRYTFDETRAWVEKVSRAVGDTMPDLVSWAWHKQDRGGKARLDYTQNAINKTLVAPYSARPAPGAPVSVPVEWDELDDPDLRSDRWTVRTVLERVADVGDPFAQLLNAPQELPSL